MMLRNPEPEWAVRARWAAQDRVATWVILLGMASAALLLGGAEGYARLAAIATGSLAAGMTIGAVMMSRVGTDDAA